jgi:hypothetical protein
MKYVVSLALLSLAAAAPLVETPFDHIEKRSGKRTARQIFD